MRLLAATALLLLCTTVTACSADTEEGGGPVATHTALDGSTYNSVDVEFASGSVPLLADAMVLVDEALAREVSPDTRALAEQVRDGRGPEIEQLVTFLGDWGEEVPETARDHANAEHGDPTEDPAPGPTADPAYERQWAAEMTEKLEKVLTLAERQVADGADEDATALAEQMKVNLAELVELLESA
ncbi:MAG: DUF305 domain-containing protein [Nocardioides sp.]|uniref:DUF305 domain-containing protein n=1 Tax=Nocardioides sp. TaxID=35761 RepID=UPI003F0CD715